MPPKLDPKVRSTAEKIGEQIRVARIAAHLSQAELAERVGMTRTNYARIEYGRTNATVETLLRIADGLGVELKISLVRRR